ncbi:hypothetical protein BMW24_013665 [Mycobacterium heckeshornense]|nr:hypothetical protein ACT16_12730 [Mycobacterium heckeshornense]PIJ34016.1 hypothetical protein BMW24_013665 [Mycobacterium heckeshornense]
MELVLFDASAVAGLSGCPTPRRARKRKQPIEGRVRLQLLADDGSVVAEGEGVAELRSVGANGRRPSRA